MTRLSVWILGDQLLADHPALAAATALTSRDAIRVILIESAQRKVKLPYQRKKLVLLISAMRHFADELRAAGYHVEYLQADSALAGLRQHVAAWQPDRLLTMEAAEFRGREFQRRQLASLLPLPVEVLPNSQFLVGRAASAPDANKKVILEHFYRAMRKRWGVLLDPQTGAPEGGAWNFDRANRKPLPPGGLAVPPALHFAPDALTQRVMDEVAALPRGVGRVDDFALAVTRRDAEAAFDDFLRHRLHSFGPYEDAMSQRDGQLFHSLLSPYMNIGLLDPLAMVRRAEAAYRAGLASLPSVEGFIRQIIGWREYIYWQYWQLAPGLLTANGWQHTRAMPRFFWDGATEMNCLKHVIARVIEQGYSHHIERLMVICNFCLLAGIDPAAVNNWFLSFYIDAYEWVVAPNVIGMGLHTDGGRIATKPYLASANYINKMSDYCAGCRFNPKVRTGADACPYNFLYWNFLAEHEAVLRANPRFGPAVLGLRHVDAEARAEIKAQAAAFLAELPAYGDESGAARARTSTA